MLDILKIKMIIIKANDKRHNGQYVSNTNISIPVRYNEYRKPTEDVATNK